MNKLKELWGNNKVLIVLGFILVICAVAVLIVTFSFFLGGNKSKYGNRLDGIDKYEISETFKSDYISKLKEDKEIENVKFDVKGWIVYVTINCAGDVAMADAQSKVAKTLNEFSDDILKNYDLNFTIISPKTDNSDGYVMIGAKNAAGTNLSWRNNTLVESEEE